MQKTTITCDACDRDITNDRKPKWIGVLPRMMFPGMTNGKNFECPNETPIDLCDDCYKQMLKAMNPRSWPRAEKAA